MEYKKTITPQTASLTPTPLPKGEGFVYLPHGVKSEGLNPLPKGEGFSFPSPSGRRIKDEEQRWKQENKVNFLVRQNLLTLLTLAFIVIMPHAPHLPIALTLFVGLILLWRFYLTWFSKKLPHKALVLFIAFAGLIGIYLNYRTIFGREAGIALLAFFLSLKLMEARYRRDAVVIILLSYFLVLTHFLYSQSIAIALLTFITTLAITLTLLSLHKPQPPL